MSESEVTGTAGRAPLSASLPELENFSLVLGGPLYQLLRRARLEERVEDHLLRRVVVIAGIAWLPLLLLCLVEGTLLGGVPIPFLGDVETHARFLLVVPLVIVAELLVHLRIRAIVSQFLERRLVPDTALERFRSAIASAVRLRNSVAAEVLLVAILFPLAYYVRTEYFSLNDSTWYARVEDGKTTATLAGMWYWWVSNPVFQFLIFRWYFRVFIWARFLWQVSRIDLDLIPTHPDRNGGLGFLGASAYALSPLLTAHGAAFAGLFANRIFYEGASLADFKLEIVVLVALLMVIVLGPLLFFMPQVLAGKRRGLRQYGNFFAEFGRHFEDKWVRSSDRHGPAMLGSPDMSSLADLQSAVNVVREMKALPFGRDTFVQLTVATVIPFAPLLFTMIPLEQLLDRIIGAVF